MNSRAATAITARLRAQSRPWPESYSGRRSSKSWTKALPDVRGNDGGRAGFPVNDVDLQDGLDILVGEVGSELFLQHRHVAGAGRKLGGSLGAIAADSRQNDYPAIGSLIAESRDERIVVGTGAGQGRVSLPVLAGILG